MTKIQKATTENESSKVVELFYELLWKIQEVQKALSVQEIVIDNLTDMLRDQPEGSEILYTLEVMETATRKLCDKMGDVENITGMLCGETTEEKNIQFSVLLDDLRMYSETGRGGRR